MGEYLGLAVDSTNAYVAFTSGRLDGDLISKGDVWFDSVPNSLIPEPATLALLLVGGLALLRRRR